MFVFENLADDIEWSDRRRVDCVSFVDAFTSQYHIAGWQILNSQTVRGLTVYCVAKLCSYHSECFACLEYWFEDVSLLLYRVKQDSRVILAPEDLLGTSPTLRYICITEGSQDTSPPLAQLHGSATVSKELLLNEAGNSALTSSVFHRLEGKFCMCALLGIVCLHSKHRNWCLPCKRRLAIANTEYDDRPSHEIEP